MIYGGEESASRLISPGDLPKLRLRVSVAQMHSLRFSPSERVARLPRGAGAARAPPVNPRVQDA
jgi:hypothetical protein